MTRFSMEGRKTHYYKSYKYNKSLLLLTCIITTERLWLLVIPEIFPQSKSNQLNELEFLILRIHHATPQIMKHFFGSSLN